MLKKFYIKHKAKLEPAILIMLFIMALIFRLIYVFKMEHAPLVTDAYNYDVMTRQFLDKGFLGYLSDKPNAIVTPGYPLFLALIYRIFGYSSEIGPIMHVRVVQAILGALSCIIVYFIGKHIKNKRTGLIAAVLYTIYPTYLWATTLVLTETLFNFFLLLYVYFQLRVFETWKMSDALLCGFTFVLAVMVRPLIFPLLIVPFAYMYIIKKDKKVIEVFKYTAAAVLVVMIPWWLRNIITMKKFILLATQTGNPLIAGTFPYYTDIDLSKYEVENQVKAGLKYIIEGFIKQPVLYLKWYTIGKWKHMFMNIWFYPADEFTFARSFTFIHFFIVSIGWVGVLFSLIKDKIRIISILIVLLTGLQLLFVPEERYAYPLIALLILVTAYTIDYLFTENNLNPSYKCNEG